MEKHVRARGERYGLGQAGRSADHGEGTRVGGTTGSEARRAVAWVALDTENGTPEEVLHRKRVPRRRNQIEVHRVEKIPGIAEIRETPVRVNASGLDGGYPGERDAASDNTEALLGYGDSENYVKGGLLCQRDKQSAESEGFRARGSSEFGNKAVHRRQRSRGKVEGQSSALIDPGGPSQKSTTPVSGLLGGTEEHVTGASGRVLSHGSKGKKLRSHKPKHERDSVEKGLERRSRSHKSRKSRCNSQELSQSPGTETSRGGGNGCSRALHTETKELGTWDSTTEGPYGRNRGCVVWGPGVEEAEGHVTLGRNTDETAGLKYMVLSDSFEGLPFNCTKESPFCVPSIEDPGGSSKKNKSFGPITEPTGGFHLGTNDPISDGNLGASETCEAELVNSNDRKSLRLACEFNGVLVSAPERDFENDVSLCDFGNSNVNRIGHYIREASAPRFLCECKKAYVGWPEFQLEVVDCNNTGCDVSANVGSVGNQCGEKIYGCASCTFERDECRGRLSRDVCRMDLRNESGEVYNSVLQYTHENGDGTSPGVGKKEFCLKISEDEYNIACGGNLDYKNSGFCDRNPVHENRDPYGCTPGNESCDICCQRHCRRACGRCPYVCGKIPGGEFFETSEPGDCFGFKKMAESQDAPDSYSRKQHRETYGNFTSEFRDTCDRSLGVVHLGSCVGSPSVEYKETCGSSSGEHQHAFSSNTDSEYITACPRISESKRIGTCAEIRVGEHHEVCFMGHDGEFWNACDISQGDKYRNSLGGNQKGEYGCSCGRSEEGKYQGACGRNQPGACRDPCGRSQPCECLDYRGTSQPRACIDACGRCKWGEHQNDFGRNQAGECRDACDKGHWVECQDACGGSLRGECLKACERSQQGECTHACHRGEYRGASDRIMRNGYQDACSKSSVDECGEADCEVSGYDSRDPGTLDLKCEIGTAFYQCSTLEYVEDVIVHPECGSECAQVCSKSLCCTYKNTVSLERKAVISDKQYSTSDDPRYEYLKDSQWLCPTGECGDTQFAVPSCMYRDAEYLDSGWDYEDMGDEVSDAWWMCPSGGYESAWWTCPSGLYAGTNCLCPRDDNEDSECWCPGDMAVREPTTIECYLAAQEYKHAGCDPNDLGCRGIPRYWQDKGVAMKDALESQGADIGILRFTASERIMTLDFGLGGCESSWYEEEIACQSFAVPNANGDSSADSGKKSGNTGSPCSDFTDLDLAEVLEACPRALSREVRTDRQSRQDAVTSNNGALEMLEVSTSTEIQEPLFGCGRLLATEVVWLERSGGQGQCKLRTRGSPLAGTPKADDVWVPRKRPKDVPDTGQPSNNPFWEQQSKQTADIWVPREKASRRVHQDWSRSLKEGGVQGSLIPNKCLEGASDRRLQTEKDAVHTWDMWVQRGRARKCALADGCDRERDVDSVRQQATLKGRSCDSLKRHSDS